MNAIGSSAASSTRPMPISRTLLAAAKWLEGRDLASLNENNELILLDDALDTQTTVSSPVLVRNSENRSEHSLWALRKELRDRGWVQDDSKPSISSRTFFGKNQCFGYYMLLLDCSLRQQLEFAIKILVSVKFKCNMCSLFLRNFF